MPTNLTVVCDKNRCVVGALRPYAIGTGTAHQRLAAQAAMANPVVGGYFDARGNIGYNSESINRVRMKGECSAQNTKFGEMMRKRLESGNYERNRRK